MIAAPDFTLAQTIAARLRREHPQSVSPGPAHSAPDTSPGLEAPSAGSQGGPPPTLSPLSTDWELLLDYLAPSLCVGSLCTKHALSPDELADFLARPDVQRTIAVIQAITAARLPLLDLHLPQAIRATHLAIVSQAPPEDPRLAARHAETARKSAGALQHLLPRAAQPQPTSAAAPEPAPPPPSPSPDPMNGAAPPPEAAKTPANALQIDPSASSPPPTHAGPSPPAPRPQPRKPASNPLREPFPPESNTEQLNPRFCTLPA